MTEKPTAPSNRVAEPPSRAVNLEVGSSRERLGGLQGILDRYRAGQVPRYDGRTVAEALRGDGTETFPDADRLIR